jgi:uncharacterized membrane protein
MTRTANGLIDAYLQKLELELIGLGAAGADDVLAEIRSLLVEAAADDPDRAETEIARFGDPAELAVGMLAERGLSPEGGMSAAAWWRMGVAVPIDIAIGLSVPLAALYPTWFIGRLMLAGGAQLWVFLVCLVAFALGGVWWPWYVWRPWRTSSPRA